MHITAQGPRLRNDLYCVEWDVKLYYTIPYHTIPFDVCVVLLTRDSFFRLCYFCYLCVLSLAMVVLVRLSVPVQVIDWKESSSK